MAGQSKSFFANGAFAYSDNLKPNALGDMFDVVKLKRFNDFIRQAREQ